LKPSSKALIHNQDIVEEIGEEDQEFGEADQESLKRLTAHMQSEEVDYPEDSPQKNFKSGLGSIVDQDKKRKRSKMDKNVKTYYEFLDRKKFLEFLYEREKPYNGILQKWVDPKGDNNHILRIIWSPKMCLFERKENIRPLNNKKLDLYERSVTYEGKEFNSKVLPVKGILVPNKMQVIANSIAKHVSNVTFERVRPARMILNFKLDP
jgi:hypothetical protein